MNYTVKMPQVCRTCLEEIPDVNCIRLNNSSFKIKEELGVCLPEVDVDLVPDAVMCIYCVNELHSCYDFKQKCLLTEKQIRTQLHSQTAIDLAELKKASELELLNGDHAPLEMVDVSQSMEIVEDDVGAGASEEVNVLDDISISVNDEDDDDEDDDINSSNLILGLCESAPRKSSAVFMTSKPTVIDIRTPTNNITPITKQSLLKSARKSTTKGPYTIISSNNLQGKHNPSSKFVCSMCNSTLPDVLEYISHIKISHKSMESQYECSRCPFTTRAPNALLSHYSIHVKNSSTVETEIPNSSRPVTYTCPHCSFESSDMRNLNKHIDGHILKCNKCYYIATNRAAYQKHISTHTLTLESDDVVVIDDDDDMPCNHCKHIAKGTVQFEKHCLNVHGIKYPYVCRECGYTAAAKASLTKHATFHTGNRLYHCSACSYNCNLVYNLNKHLASRHGLK